MKTRKTLDEETIKKLYFQWLRGVSLRRLAPIAGVSHNVLANTFRKVYGQHATNPVATSLARSVLEDYPDDPRVDQWIRALVDTVALDETHKHRSAHSLQQLTLYQTPTKDNFLEGFAQATADPWEWVEQQDRPAPPGYSLVLWEGLRMSVGLAAGILAYGLVVRGLRLILDVDTPG